MKKLTLTNHAQSETTVLENEFIDRYMPQANGEYVKVYLLLLRHLGEPSGTLTVSRIADLLDDTEKDVLRALNYWKKQGLLDYEASGEVKNVALDTEEDLADAPDGTANDAGMSADVSNIQQYKSRKEFKELLFVAEQYLGKTLSVTDVDTITYFYEDLKMSTELIEYLIEYCVEIGHKSMHYIRSVARSWNEKNITTVEEAKSQTFLYNKNCYSVLNAYGIKGRGPSPSEISYIKKWSEEYGFDLEIILEACNRTMNAIHTPNFEYTDSILKNWASKDVRSMDDIAACDAAYQKEKAEHRQQKKARAPHNQFNNFENRSYDIDDVKQKLVEQ